MYGKAAEYQDCWPHSSACPAVCLFADVVVDLHDCLARMPCSFLLAVIFMADSLMLCGICLLSMDLVFVLPKLQLPLTFNDTASQCVSWILLQPVKASSCAYLDVPPCTAHMLITSSPIYAISALAGCVLEVEPRVRVCNTMASTHSHPQRLCSPVLTTSLPLNCR